MSLQAYESGYRTVMVADQRQSSESWWKEAQELWGIAWASYKSRQHCAAHIRSESSKVLKLPAECKNRHGSSGCRKDTDCRWCRQTANQNQLFRCDTNCPFCRTPSCSPLSSLRTRFRCFFWVGGRTHNPCARHINGEETRERLMKDRWSWKELLIR